MTIITQAYLRTLFRYEDGKLFWIVPKSQNARVGDEVGWEMDGYLCVEIDGRAYKVHCLIWILHYGEIPDGMEIDHRDTNRKNNRILNLRLATHTQNQRNSGKRKGTKSKYKGISWHKGQQKWNAVIQIDGKRIHIASFTDELEAHKAYCAVAAVAFGEFFNNGGSNV